MDKRIFLSMLWCLVGCTGVAPARNWRACSSSCAKAPKQRAKRYDVVPLGYPYGKEWTGLTYLGPYAGAYHPRDFWPYTFGYSSLWGHPLEEDDLCLL